MRYEGNLHTGLFFLLLFSLFFSLLSFSSLLNRNCFKCTNSSTNRKSAKLPNSFSRTSRYSKSHFLPSFLATSEKSRIELFLIESVWSVFGMSRMPSNEFNLFPSMCNNFKLFGSRSKLTTLSMSFSFKYNSRTFRSS